MDKLVIWESHDSVSSFWFSFSFYNICICLALHNLNIKKHIMIRLQHTYIYIYFFTLPVDTGALYTEGDTQIDAGPTGVWLATVAAAGVAWDGQDLLQGTLSFDWPLL